MIPADLNSYRIEPPRPQPSLVRQSESHLPQIVGYPLFIAEDESFKFVALNNQFEKKGALTSMNFKSGLNI